MESKICSKCGVEKILGDFHSHKGGKGGVASQCKDCKREYGRKHAKEVYLLDPEKAKEKYTKWRRENPDKVRAQLIAWRNKNRVAFNASVKERKDRDRDKYRELARPYARLRTKEKRNTVKGRLSMNISTAVYQSLKGEKGRRHWEDLLGYTVSELKQHLEKQFVDGMSWSNYGQKGWSIDHKTPVSAFNFETPSDFDFLQCWDLRNLRPLWHIDNIKKNDRLEIPFQPSLLI
ncbi:MAG: hypothetical protein WC294_00145 [Methanoregula sp.]|jgi:hypothetical protein